jgi:septal ring factor EnvC (AmiA/AmiB activator)
LVATGITYRSSGGPGVEGAAHVYLCRLCVTRAARCLGMIKGAENERLEGAADALAEAEREIAERQALIEQLTGSLAEKDRKITVTQGYLEELQAEKAQQRHLAEVIVSNARELAGVA